MRWDWPPGCVHWIYCNKFEKDNFTNFFGGKEASILKDSSNEFYFEDDFCRSTSWDIRIHLANKGLIFYGGHGSNVNLYAVNFVAYGGKLVEVYAIDEIPVASVGPNGKVPSDHLKEIRHYYKFLRLAKLHTRGGCII